MENSQPNFFLKIRMKKTQPPTTAKVLAGILARIKSGEELPEDCVKYRHVAGEISAYGALFADSSKRHKSRSSNK
jgi:hypothetical protein